jgi:hypothetical protein
MGHFYIIKIKPNLKEWLKEEKWINWHLKKMIYI